MKTVSENQIFKAGNYSAEILERDNLSKFPLHPYSVKMVRHTPKGKYLTQKTLKIYVYKTIAEAEQSAKKWIDNIQANINTREAEKQKTRDKNKNVIASDFFKVGDIIVNSWGYEQTNIDFYIVTNVRNKQIIIKEVGGKIEDGSMYSHGMACNVVPNIDVIGDKIYTLKVKAEGMLSQPTKYYYMHKWNGKPEYQSWYN